MLKRSIIGGLAALAVFPFAAWCAQRFPDYPIQRATDCAVVARKDGVTIGLQPVDSVQDQLTYFHVALSPRGFLPIFVVIHNESKDDLLLDKSAISYGADNGPAENTGPQKAGVMATAAIPFVGAFIAGGLVESESQIKQNLILRELQSDTLAPGGTMRGFLYVLVPKKGARPKLHIHFPIAWSGSGKASVVDLTF